MELAPPYAGAGGYGQDPSKPPGFVGQSTDGPYTGFKFELPADNRGQPLPPSSYPRSNSTLTVSPHLSTVSPDHLSVSHVSSAALTPGYAGSAGYVSPQSTGTTGYLGEQGHGYRGPGSVSEMQG